MGSADSAVRAYYDAIDGHDYEAFADLLAPGVTHYRPDRTIDGREALVAFMRDERPDAETTHEVCSVFAADGEIAVRGRLLDAADEPLFEFVDVFSVEDGDIATIRTYTK